jgi:hypothetical protein
MTKIHFIRGEVEVIRLDGRKVRVDLSKCLRREINGQDHYEHTDGWWFYKHDEGWTYETKTVDAASKTPGVLSISTPRFSYRESEWVVSTLEWRPKDEPRNRLVAIIDVDPPYFLLDGKPILAAEIAVKYVAALIDAKGAPVSFAEWLKGHPEFAGAISTRVMDKIPAKVAQFVERGGKGRPAHIKVDMLSAR